MIVRVKSAVKKGLNYFSLSRKILYLRDLHYKYGKMYKDVTFKEFCSENISKCYVEKTHKRKVKQIAALLERVDIEPVKSEYFFYSIDCFKSLSLRKSIYDNYTVDYSRVVEKSFAQKRIELEKSINLDFAKNEILLINSFYEYLQRVKKDEAVMEQYSDAIEAIETLFVRPSDSFFEALQRILFLNQMIWQTKHKNNGLGHLDWLLIDYYTKDIDEGRLNRETAKAMLKDFMFVLHENYWFKSSCLLGDTGQIIILGGVDENGEYVVNELTDLFIEVMAEIKLPEPKILLRCSDKMTDELIKKSIECIATGIGAPLLSNDDVIVQKMIEFGYDKKASYNYATAACWEPAVVNDNCVQNNVKTLNFLNPFIELMNENIKERINTYEELISEYENKLGSYIKRELEPYMYFVFEEDPIVSLLSDSAMEKGMDIVAGGARYSDIGFTTIGTASVVNSILNLKKIVFENNEYTLTEINEIRKDDFENNDILLKRLKDNVPSYGSDDIEVVSLVNHITAYAATEFGKYRTAQGGKFKFGLSAPSYVEEGRNTEAAFDGRKAGEPLNVHISSQKGVTPAELLSFVSKLDFSGCRINGNVADFIVTPRFLQDNIDKFILLIRAAIKNGLYQLQINVVDSATLIAAKKNPDKYPNLIVRVWGFSSYFKDLPEEYQDLLIQRALESEKVA